MNLQRMCEAIGVYVIARGVLLDPEHATGRCAEETEAFMKILSQYGISSSVITGLRTDDDDSSLVKYGHFATRVDDRVWDWTYRQFDPACPVPRVIPVEQFYTEWQIVTDGAMR